MCPKISYKQGESAVRNSLLALHLRMDYSLLSTHYSLNSPPHYIKP